MKHRIKILLIEDDEDDYILTLDIINEIPGEMYDLEWVTSYEEGLVAIRKNHFDVFLLDYRLGKENGLELLKKMKSSNTAPLILLTGQGDRELDMEAMEAGASDFLVKADLNPTLIDRSIRYAIKQHQTIIELQKKEEELQELNSNLERLVTDRTIELRKAHKELKIALDAEKQLSELKSRLVSMASHEFKVPLTSILTSVSLIEKYSESEHQNKRIKHIERIKSSVQNLTNILNDFLSLEKIESGSLKSEPEPIIIETFVNDLLDELNPLLRNGQTIKFIHKGENSFSIDKYLFKNVLINLLSNAIKYSPDGKNVTLNTSFEKKYLNIQVIDQGIGIPEEDKKHMFERFFRAGNASKIEGTGLGLTIVKRYLDHLGGSIRFESELYKGTSFFVEMPVMDEF